MGEWIRELPTSEGPYWWRLNAGSPVLYMAVKRQWGELAAWPTFDKPDESVWSPWFKAYEYLVELGGEWLEIRRPQ